MRRINHMEAWIIWNRPHSSGESARGLTPVWSPRRVGRRWVHDDVVAAGMLVLSLLLWVEDDD